MFSCVLFLLYTFLCTGLGSFVRVTPASLRLEGARHVLKSHYQSAMVWQATLHDKKSFNVLSSVRY